MRRCDGWARDGRTGSSKRAVPQAWTFKPPRSRSRCASSEYDPRLLSRTDRLLDAIAPPQIFLCSLFRDRFSFYRRVGPIHRTPGNCQPLVKGHEVFKRKRHDPLGKELRVPFDEANFPPIQEGLVPVGTQNKRDLRPDGSSASELPLNGRACGEVELVSFLGRPSLFALHLNC